jgi:ubiquinone/menaquinone biosynthesis C-methylase UbiE
MQKKLSTLLNAEIDPAFAKRSQFIFEGVASSKPKRILDIGCGRGFYLNAFSLFDFVNEIHGVDINTTYLKKAKKNAHDKRIHIKKGSVYELPFPDRYFDMIVCSELLEHLDDEQKALIEIKRVLKQNGTLIVTVPNHNFPFLWDPINWILMKGFNAHVPKDRWWIAGIWADHVRLYTEKKLKVQVIKAGFTIIKLNRVIHHCWPFSHFILYGIGKNLVERIGLKEFDRFNTKPKKVSEVVARIFALPSLLDKNITSKTSYMNILVSMRKK